MTRSLKIRMLDALTWLAFAAIAAGTALVAFFIGSDLRGSIERERSVRAFAMAQAVGAPLGHPGSSQPDAASESDRDPLGDALPEGVLRLPALGIEVAVFYGTDEATLRRGAGRVEWTPPLGSDGNVGIAAHRDGAFSPLRRVSVGDEVLLDWSGGTLRYRVDDYYVVDPDDVHVLDAMGTPHLTLVTCYPFDFVGAAPRRFIVHARLLRAGSLAAEPKPGAASDRTHRVLHYSSGGSDVAPNHG